MTAALLVFACAAAQPGAAQERPLAEIGGKSASQWRDQLASSDADARRQAAWALGQLRPPTEATVDALVGMLKDPNTEPRWFAVQALGELRAAAAVEAMSAALESPLNDATFRRLAAEALGRIGPEAEAAQPVLERAAASKEPRLRVAAVLALWRIERDETSIERLGRELSGSDAAAAFDAALAIRELGESAAPLTRPLIAALAHPQRDIRHAAGEALGALGPPAETALIQSLPSGAEDRFPWLVALGPIIDRFRAADAEPASFPATLNFVARAAVEGSPAERRKAIDLLARFGPRGLSRLLAMLEEPTQRQAATEALARMQPWLSGPSAVRQPELWRRPLPDLKRLLGHEEAEVRRAAARTAAALPLASSEDETLDAPLRQLLASEDVATRRYAAAALAKLRPAP